MESLQTDPRSRDWLTALGLDSGAAIVKFFAPSEPPLTTTVIVIPRTVQLPDKSTRSVFYKLYEYASPSWHFWGRRSKARCEFENYAAFEQLGIPTARRVACGEIRDPLGRLCRAFIVTEEIPRAWMLPQFVEEFCPNRATAESRQLRDGLCRQMASLARRMHDGGFFHYDLVWRNILVTWSPPESPKVWWIDCPRGGFSRQHRRRLNDLASLDKMAAMVCTRTERVTFLKAYDGDWKALAREVLAYRRKRWRRSDLEITPEFLPLLREHKLDTVAAIMAHPVEHVMRAVPGRSTIRLPMGIYLKRYEPEYYSLLKRVHPYDEATHEWNATHALLRAGFNAPKPVASGRQGLRSFVMTLEIAGGIDSEAKLKQLDEPGRTALLGELGRLSRQFHDAGFIHKDLYLRHIFVVGPALYFIDLQRLIGPGKFARRWRVKDLASLAHSIVRMGWPVDELFRQYGGDARLMRRVDERMTWLSRRRPKYIGVWNDPEKSKAEY